MKKGGQVRLPFYYGWVIVGLGVISTAFWTGIRSSFSVFYVKLLEEFGWSRAGAAGVLSVSFVSYLALAAVTGGLVDRWGPKRVILPGIVILSAGLTLCSLTNSLLDLYLFFGVIVGAGVTFISITPYSAIIAHWFERKRGVAVGVAVSGMGLGTFALVPVTHYLINGWGWRGAFVGLAVLAFVALFPASMLLLRHKPQEMGLNPDGVITGGTPARRIVVIVDPTWAETAWSLGRALRTTRYWSLHTFAFLSIVPIYLMVVHCVAFLVDKGFQQGRAAWCLSIVRVISLGFRIFWGWLSDHIGREPTFSMGVFFVALAAATLLAIDRTGVHALAYVFAVSLGIGWGVTAPMFVATCADLFQGRRFGLIYGVVEATIGGAGAFGSWFGGIVFDRTQSYAFAFLLCVVFALLSGIVVWFSAPRKVRRVRRVPGASP